MSSFFNSTDRLPPFIASVGIGILLIAGGIAMRSTQQQATEVAIAQATQTAFVTDTPTTAPTATITLTPSETPVPSNTPLISPTPGPPTNTPLPSDTPSPTPVPASTAHTGEFATPAQAASTAIPTPVERISVPSGVTNIMLLGSDRREDGNGYRTDTIIIVSVNRDEGTVNMLSLPRDLYVYIPGYTMERINVADGRGSAVGWPGGGPGLLRDTLLYNFGITVHYYARVDFSGFQGIVDAIGGIDVPVDCAISGKVLREPRLTREDFDSYDGWVNYTGDENNWRVQTLGVGVHHLDGYNALWYARVREGFTDFDRARRQQQVLRAILAQGQSIGMVTRIPELYNQYIDLVETDMGLGNMLQLAPIAANIDSSKINSYILTNNELIGWQVPENGQQVLLPNPGAVENLLSLAMQPPAENYLAQNTVTVEIRNGTPTDRLDEVAADRLGLIFGLLPIPTGVAPEGTGFQDTVIYDFTGQQKTRQLSIIQSLLRVPDADVIVQPDPNRVVDYIVVLGSDYASCTYQEQRPIAPIPTSTPTASP